jgi:hypothetical protein
VGAGNLAADTSDLVPDLVLENLELIELTARVGADLGEFGPEEGHKQEAQDQGADGQRTGCVCCHVGHL